MNKFSFSSFFNIISLSSLLTIDRAKMRLYDCEQTAQTDVVDSGQEEEYSYDDKPKKSFDGFKF